MSRRTLDPTVNSDPDSESVFMNSTTYVDDTLHNRQNMDFLKEALQDRKDLFT